jgi:hypothetical protein
MLKKALCATTLACVAGFSNASVITQEFIVDRQLTNFTHSITYDLFDSLGGTRQLESVELILVGKTNGTAEVENRNTEPTLVSATFASDMTLRDVNSALLIDVAPSFTHTAMLESFDGTVDFMGPSGVEFINLATSDSNNTIIDEAIALMEFVGTGTSSITFEAVSSSFVTGGGNLNSRFSMFASSDVTVTYNYRDITQSVNAPATFGLVGFSLLAMAGIRKLKP